MHATQPLPRALQFIWGLVTHSSRSSALLAGLQLSKKDMVEIVTLTSSEAHGCTMTLFGAIRIAHSGESALFKRDGGATSASRQLANDWKTVEKD